MLKLGKKSMAFLDGGEWLLLIFLAFRPTIDVMRHVSIFGIGSTPINLNVLIGVLFFFWGGYYLYKYRNSLPLHRITWVMTALVCVMIFSLIYSGDRITTLSETVKIINIFLFFLLGYVFVKEKRISIHELLSVIALSAVVPILFGLNQLVTGSGITTYNIHNRIFGTFAHPNVFAFFLMFLLFMLSYHAWLRPTELWKKYPWLKYGVFILLGLLIMFTFTRAAWIGVAVFFITLGFIYYHKIAMWIMLGILIFYAAFFPINEGLKYVNIDLQKNPIISRLTTRDPSADSIFWRLELLRENAPIIARQPILGYGYGTFPLVWTQYRSVYRQLDDSAEAHNDYLRLAVEIGVVGLALYVILLAELIRTTNKPKFSTKKRMREYAYLTSFMVAFAVVSLSDNMLHHTPVMWMMWVYLGAMMEDVV